MLSSGVKGTTHPKIETYSKNEAKSNNGAVSVLLFLLQSKSYGQTWIQRPHVPTVDIEACLAGAPTQISKAFASEAKAAADV